MTGMKALIFTFPSAVWVVLTLATILSWWLGTDHGFSGENAAQYNSIALMVIAFFKVRLVIMHFMEIHNAPLVLRGAMEVWVFGVCATLIGLYLFLPAAM